MPILLIHHKTEYRYAHPVAFGEHRIMLLPLPGHDLRILAHRLAIEPEPMRLRWIHDVFGNSVAIATFDERADTLTFTATSTVEHDPAQDFALTPDDPAYFYPFLYDDEEFPEAPELLLNVCSRRSVALGIARMIADVERLAKRDRDRVEVSEPPVLRAVDRAADDRGALLHGDHGGTG